MGNRALRTSVLLSLLWLSSLGNRAAAADRVDSLVRFLPANSNGLVVVRVAELLNSPRGQQEDWRGHDELFLAGSDSVPAWIDVIVIGTAFQPGHMGDDWSAAVLPLPAKTTVESIANFEGKPLQSIGDTPAFYSQRYGYVLQLSPGIAGVMSPAQRQNTARWIREVRSRRQSALSDYLGQAARRSDQIVMALDMFEMFDPDVIRKRLESIPTLRGQAEELRRCADTLRGLRGVTFTANVVNDTEARLAIDFSSPLTLAAARLKQVFLDFLDEEGAQLADFKESTASLQGNSLILTTQLSDQGLRRIMSLGVSPCPYQPDLAARAPAPTTLNEASSNQADMKGASQRYYASISRVIDDLSTRLSLATQDAIAIWIEQDAMRIENLGTRDVDPDLMKFGADVSGRLRAITASLRGTRVAVDTEQQTLTYNVRVNTMPVGRWGGGWYGWPRTYGWGANMVPYYQTESNLAEVRANQAQAIREGAAQREQIWQSIIEGRAAIRQQMLQRYGDGFK